MTQRLDIEIRQGETWSETYTHLDGNGDAFDLTGYTARMAIKRDFASPTIAYLSTGSDAQGGTLTLGDGAGTVVMSMTAAQSAALMEANPLPWRHGSPQPAATAGEPIEVFRYDLEINSGSAVTRILEGRVIVHREITA